MRTERLTDRLRGIYIIPVNDGAGLLDGKDTFTHHFETVPIQQEAAQVIDELVAALRDAEQFIAKTSGGGETDFRAKLNDVLAKASAP